MARVKLSNNQWGLFEGFLSAGINILLFAFKIWIGLLTNSVAMIADAWHTLSDTFTSAIVVFGFWIGEKPGDKDHPFGHGRAELVGAVVIGTLLAVVGINFVKESYLQLKGGETPVYSRISILVFGISGIIKEGLAQFSIRLGKKNNSRALIADGWHHRSDAVASIIIVVGALLGGLLPWIDGILGFAVSILILFAAYEVLKDAASMILGTGVDGEMAREIQKVLKREAPEVRDAHHIHVHRYGDHVEATLHVSLPSGMSLDTAHGISNQLEKALRDELGLEPTIHLEPETET